MGSSRWFHFKICQVIYLLKMFIILWRIFIYATGYLVMNSAVLAKSYYFGKFFEILLGNNIIPLRSHVHWQSKNHSEVIWVHVFQFFIKGSMSQKYFLKIYFRDSTRPRFRWLTKLAEIIKVHNRSFWGCNSLLFHVYGWCVYEKWKTQCNHRKFYLIWWII